MRFLERISLSLSARDALGGATENLDRFIEKRPANLQALLFRATLARARLDLGSARADIERAFSIAPSNRAVERARKNLELIEKALLSTPPRYEAISLELAPAPVEALGAGLLLVERMIHQLDGGDSGADFKEDYASGAIGVALALIDRFIARAGSALALIWLYASNPFSSRARALGRALSAADHHYINADLPSALKNLGEAMKIDPDDILIQAQYLLIALEVDPDSKSARAMIDRFENYPEIESDPTNQLILQTRAQIAWNSRSPSQIELAGDLYEELARLDRHTYHYPYRAGLARLKSGRLDAAYENFVATARRLNPALLSERVDRLKDLRAL